MTAETSNRMSGIHLPIALTVGRIAAVPVFVGCLYLLEGDVARWTAFALFVVASFTDWLDGHLARLWQQQSALGAMLDPIADKLLVGAALMMLVFDETITGSAIIPALIIMCREILVSGLREFLAGLNVKILVTFLAKWKTFLQFFSIALLLVGPAIQGLIPGTTEAGVVLLWIAAFLTIWTGWGYLRAGIDHASRQ